MWCRFQDAGEHSWSSYAFGGNTNIRTEQRRLPAARRAEDAAKPPDARLAGDAAQHPPPQPPPPAPLAHAQAHAAPHERRRRLIHLWESARKKRARGNRVSLAPCSLPRSAAHNSNPLLINTPPYGVLASHARRSKKKRSARTSLGGRFEVGVTQARPARAADQRRGPSSK